jgi:hypothetical protein
VPWNGHHEESCYTRPPSDPPVPDSGYPVTCGRCAGRAVLGDEPACGPSSHAWGEAGDPGGALFCVWCNQERCPQCLGTGLPFRTSADLLAKEHESGSHYNYREGCPRCPTL